MQGSVHLGRALTAGESVSDLRADLIMLVWRALLCAAAVVSLWALNRRRVMGRWGTVGLGCVAFYLTLPELAHSWRAIWGDYATPVGYAAYSSAEQGVIAFVIAAGITSSIGVLIVRLALGDAADRFFESVH